MFHEQTGKSSLQTQLEEQQAISKPLISTEPIPETDFQIITTPEGSFLAIGEYRITEIMDKEQLKGLINDRDWRLIRAVIIHIAAKTVEKMEIEKIETLRKDN